MATLREEMGLLEYTLFLPSGFMSLQRKRCTCISFCIKLACTMYFRL